MEVTLLSLISLILTFMAFFPFIKLLYRLKLSDPAAETHTDTQGKATPIFVQLRSNKKGTPIGAGVLVVIMTTLFYVLFVSQIGRDVNVVKVIGLLATFIGFGAIGLYDDIRKTFHLEGRAFQLKSIHKWTLQIIVAVLISTYLVSNNAIFLGIPGILNITHPLLIVFFCTSIIVFFANALNITDGVDGLASGLFLITLLPLFAFALYNSTTFITSFIAILAGGLIATLYFNVYPARVFLGDTGALSFGAVFAVIALLLGISYILPFLGFIFIIEAISTLIQWFWKRLLGKKLFPIAPLHYTFEYIGWPETKVVFRGWILQIVLVLVTIIILFH